MPRARTTDPPTHRELIPPPPAIRRRIGLLATELALLRRLLRLADDRAKVLPATAGEVADAR